MTIRMRPYLLPMALFSLAAACGSAPDGADGMLDDVTTGAADGAARGRFLLERVDDTAIAQLYADGFEDLSLRDKQLAYHLSQAALAGRDIFLDQRFEYNLALRWILESFWLVRYDLDPATRQEVERYCKLFWVHSGIHDNLSTEKHLLGLDWDQFERCCEAATAAGHALGAVELAPLRDLREAYAVMTDETSYRSVTDKSTEGGNDP
ncbi:MAG: hypothetical protein KDE27_30060, partial [Planctomycetes bacterium]|nr:hypothetical protein [Planctomycetota bacterium]